MSTNRDDFGIAIRSALLKKSTRQKFSLFFLICFSVLILFLDSYPNKIIDNTRSFINDIIYKASSVASSPLKLFSFIANQSKTHFLVYEENKILKAELDKLKMQKFNNSFNETQSKDFQRFFKEDIKTSNSKVLAKVLLDKDSPFLKSIIINRGSKYKIKKGMPVLDGNYLVGRVVETNYLSSRVLLLNDLNSRIPVTIDKTAVQAILTGRGELKPYLEYLPDGYIPSDELIIFTSGKDGIFTQGVPIGKTKVLNEKVQIKLLSDPNQLSYVSVEIVEDIEEIKN
jgi:rod shape-determining protein MreC